MVANITENEERVLLALKDGVERNLEEVAKTTGLPDSAVASAIESLSMKNLLKKSTSSAVFAEPTERAMRISSLPEDSLYATIGESMTLSAAKSESHLDDQSFNAALAWGIKRGLIRLVQVDGQEGVERRIERLNPPQKLGEVFQRLKEQRRLPVNEAPAELEILKERQLAALKQRSEVRVRAGAELSEGYIRSLRRPTVLSHKTLVDGSYRTLEVPPYQYALRRKASFHRGKNHFYLEFLQMVKETLVAMGFEEMYGPYIEYEFWNFDALFVPQNHIAREAHQSYAISGDPHLPPAPAKDLMRNVGEVHAAGGTTGSIGWGSHWSPEIALRLVLRSHTTSVSARKLGEHPGDAYKFFTIDRNFRRDPLDATHLPEFQQCEGIVGGEHLTFRNLLGFLEEFARSFGVTKIRFKPGYFPFTEPSVEAYIYHENLGWVEAAPGGMFRPEVTVPLGITHPVLAWGIGITRFAMAYYGLNDIRELVTQDLETILLKEEAVSKFANNRD